MMAMRSDAYDISLVAGDAPAAPPLRMVFDKADFAYMCMCLDDLLGRPRLMASEYAFDKIKYDRARSAYPEALLSLAQDTRLGSDLPMLFRYVMESVAGKNTTPDGQPLGMSKTKKKARLPMRTLTNAMSFLVSFADRCPFEPRWHMEYRGDTRRLRNVFPGNVWSFLVRSYTMPELYDEDLPEHVQMTYRRTRGYAHCVDQARHDELTELRRMYGEEYGRHGRGRDESLRKGGADYDPVMSMDEILSGGLPF